MLGRRRVGGVVFTLVTVMLCACTGAPDRRGEAARLETAIAGMPGVQSFSASITNDITYGATLRLEADMSAASEEQIAAVVSRIKELERDDFDKYEQTTEFSVGDGVSVQRNADFDPEQIAGDARRLRQLKSTLQTSVGTMSWFRSKSADTMEFRDAENPQQILTAVRGVAADQAVKVTISNRSGATDPLWTVTFPFTADQQTSVLNLLTALPTSVSAVDVDEGHIARLSVGIKAGSDPERDITTVINSIGPTTRHPLYLQWGGYSPDPTRGFQGSVDIAACAYGAKTLGDEDPEKYYTADAIALQKKLRTQYDTCRR
ncbi:hypothetical protein ACIP5Y_36890 [Nocardia sp. NPDC088792]|uniref:hypothetical protein n=1 Tax=Nocardia sp. NPDC088792 TaxID=3364332 RepID=UPI003817ACA8